jgi:arabinofuranosyltransferase
MELAHAVPTAKSKWVALGAVAVLLGLVLRTSWVTEDAYITLRTVDNWVHGHGLTWNIDERVQAYTHPAWMFMLSAVYYVTRESFVTTIVLGWLTTAAAALTLVHFARTAGHAVAGVVLLTLSHGFIEFSTGGLENPLSHLLLATFIGLYAVRGKPLWQLSLVAAVLALSRIDALIVVMPALVHASYLERREHGWKHTLRALALGFSPFLAWEAFSLFYYGFPFPNTAYAKLNTGLPRLEVLQQGLVYWVSGLGWDAALHIVALFGVATAFVQRRPRDICLALGLLGYELYVINIGGDFMHGRFFTIPFFTGACLIAISELPLERPAAAGAVLLPFGLLFVHPLATESYPVAVLHMNGIADERSYYRDQTSLVLFNRNRSMPAHAWFAHGRELKSKNVRTFMYENIGFLGYAAGPGVHIIDQLALSEPLLARLPMRYRHAWRVGHYARQVPAGFFETAEAGGVCKMPDIQLCEYYGHLRDVIAGPLFSWSRFKTIVAFNLGLYEHLVDREQYRYPELAHTSLDSLLAPVPEQAMWNAPGTRQIQDDGLMIDLGKPSHAARMEVMLDGNDRYDLEFLNGRTVVGRIESKGIDVGLMRGRTLVLPERATKEGFSRILVRPSGGDGMFAIGYVRLHDK